MATTMVDENGVTQIILPHNLKEDEEFIVDSSRVSEQKLRVRREAESLSTIIVYSLILILFCLSIFNLYLLNWIWLTLGGNTVGSFGKDFEPTTGKRLPIDLLASTKDTLRFTNDYLIASSNFEVDSISSPASELQISSSAFTKTLATNQASNRGEQKQDANSSIEFYTNSDKLLEFTSSGSVKFPAGFQVRYLASHNSSESESNNVILNCKPKTQICNFNAQTIKYLNKNGLDFDGTAIQLSRLKTNRIHSPTNTLSLRTNGDLEFKSSTDSINIQSLDDLTLSSHNKAVILNSNFINISSTINTNDFNGDFRIKTPQLRNNRNNRKNIYRLCVCLDRLNYQQNQFVREAAREQTLERATSTSTTVSASRRPPTSARILSNTNGLVFAIRAHLSCIKFTPFCTSPDGFG